MLQEEFMKVSIGASTLELVIGNIVTEETEAIVNPAQKSLCPGGGADGEIHIWGGPRIWEECREFGGCEPGHAVITSGGDLPAKYVIHTVGPIWTGGGSNEAETLASCYRECLRIAKERNIASIAFPAISTGNYGYPMELAAPIAIETVVRHLKKHSDPKLVRFLLKGRRAFDVHCSTLKAIFAGL
jgi:O-acetyl-ADP-ribose deacetylase (regulator of RNase III)